ncbi:MAG: RNA polymerase sigma factor, partial [Vulcanimicrobiota bacterium]
MDPDLEIVRRFKDGDKLAFTELVNKYKKPILNLVYKMTGRVDEAEDMAQEVFLRAYKGLPKFKENARFFTWLYKIGINLALRKRQRNSKFNFQSLNEKLEEGNSEVKQAITESEIPEKMVQDSELQQEVRKAIL